MIPTVVGAAATVAGGGGGVARTEPEPVSAQPMPAELHKSTREHGYFEVAP